MFFFPELLTSNHQILSLMMFFEFIQWEVLKFHPFRILIMYSSVWMHSKLARFLSNLGNVIMVLLKLNICHIGVGWGVGQRFWNCLYLPQIHN